MPTFAALWDMDGTLVDTAEHHFLAWQEVCVDLGREFTRADFAATFGRRNPDIMPHLFGDRFSPDEAHAFAEHKEARYRELARGNVVPLPGAAELVRALHAAGWLQAIGSSAPRANLAMILESTGLSPCLGAVVGSEDTSRGKPDPEVFLTGAKKLGVAPSQCVVFEDAPAGIQAARAAGMRCVADHPAEALLAAGADRVVATLAEISVAELDALVSATYDDRARSQ
jgi:beta-phosphoglucomutase